MKKLLLSFLAGLTTIAGHAQSATDTYVINKNDGTSLKYVVQDNNYLKVTNPSTLGIYTTGFEEFGPTEELNIADIKNITFNIQHDYPVNVAGIQLADNQATDKAKNLYRYLRLIYGVKTVSGIMADVSWNHKEADKIHQITGKYPAINCYDFIHIQVPEGNGWIDYNDITPVTEWADAGGIVNLMWHFNVPKTENTTIGNDGSGVTVKPDETTFKASNALVAGTWEYKYFHAQMDKVCNVLLKLQDAGVVALWRPFHEAAGNAKLKSGASWGKAWFWWGADGAATFKELWQTMFHYFQNKGIHNLIWEWTAQNYNGDSTQYDNDSDWYPGDAFVDIVGRDLYGYAAARQATEYNQLRTLYPTKMITLAECGLDNATPTANIGEAWDAGAKWLNFMPWYGTAMPSNEWWKSAMGNANVLARGDINLNATFVEESAQSAVNNFYVGCNLGNTLDANGGGKGLTLEKYETYWGQPVTTQAMMTFLKANGVSSIRIPVTWYEHMDDAGNVDDAWMNRVKEVTDYALSAGLYVIVNVHHDTAAGKGAWIKADMDVYNNTKERFKKLWTQIANTFRDYDQHLLFEGYNEMLDASNTWNAPKNSSSYTALNNYVQDFVDAVRATGGNNAKRNLIVNTYAGAKGAEVLRNFNIPTDPADNHLIAEVHSYDPWNWINTHGEWNAECHNALTNIFSDLTKKFTTVPFIIGEYGTAGEAGPDGLETTVTSKSSEKLKKAAADQAADIARQAKAAHAAAFNWMSIFDGQDRTVPQWSLPNVVEALKAVYGE